MRIAFIVTRDQSEINKPPLVQIFMQYRDVVDYLNNLGFEEIKELDLMNDVITTGVKTFHRSLQKSFKRPDIETITVTLQAATVRGNVN
jgi:hypothetical protein